MSAAEHAWNSIETGNVRWEREWGCSLNQMMETWVTLEQSKKWPETMKCTNPGHQQGPGKPLEMVCQKQKEHKKWESSKKIKSLEKKRLGFHGVSSTGWGLWVNGAEKAWNEQFILKWIKATDFGQSRICQGCDRVRIWALSCFKACSELCKVWETYCYSLPKKNCSVTSYQEFRPNGAG